MYTHWWRKSKPTAIGPMAWSRATTTSIRRIPRATSSPAVSFRNWASPGATPGSRPTRAGSRWSSPSPSSWPAPTGGNPDEIPNEDSIGFEFDDTNLFNLNRFPGVDRVDSGTRVDYGLNWLGELGELGNSNIFVGQSYRITKPEEDIFTARSGVRDRLSDIVGRVQLNPIKEVDLLYRFRLSKDNLKPQRNELGVRAGVPALNFKIDYISIEGDSNSERFGDREEITGRISSQLTKNWAASFSHKRDLGGFRALEHPHLHRLRERLLPDRGGRLQEILRRPRFGAGRFHLRALRLQVLG